MRAEIEAAIRAAKHAQDIADSRAGADQITSKGGIDLVTAADIACEDKIREELLRAFPDYPVIGEERGGEPVEGRPYWLVDPICGTRLFASNIPLYCHNIALVENGEVTVAAVGVGKSKEILFAEKGQGSWIRTTKGERRLSVSDRSHAIWIDGGPLVGDVLARAVRSKRWYVWMYSTTLSVAHLADGRIAGILHLGSPRAVIRTPGTRAPVVSLAVPPTVALAWAKTPIATTQIQRAVRQAFICPPGEALGSAHVFVGSASISHFGSCARA